MDQLLSGVVFPHTRRDALGLFNAQNITNILTIALPQTY